MILKNQILLTCILLLGVVIAYGQTSINASGGEASGDGGTVSFSVGQVGYQTNNGVTGSVAEGVQQPYEISVVTGIDEFIEINLSVSAYPNPVTDFLQLKVDGVESNDLSYQVYDINGKLLQSKQLNGDTTPIDMGSYSNATYFVAILKSDRKVKTFKVVKR